MAVFVVAFRHLYSICKSLHLGNASMNSSEVFSSKVKSFSDREKLFQIDQRDYSDLEAGPDVLPETT